MNSLLYLVGKQLKNIIRKLTSKPLALIGYIFIGIMLLGSMVMLLLMPSGTVNHGSNELFSAIFTGLIIIAMYFSLKRGIEKGSSYFRYSDVNFVFTSPIKPNKVLLYGFIKRMGTSLFIVLFSMFQLPNIKNNFALKGYGVWLMLLAVLFYSLMSHIPGMILYTFTSVSNKRRVITKRALDFLVLAFTFGLLMQIFEKRNVMEAFVQYLNSGIFAVIPIVGQLRTIVAAAVYGVDSYFYYSVLILIAMLAAFILILYKTDPDYYEDVLGATEHTERLIKAKREGKGVEVNKKIRKVKGGFSSKGAKVFFEKHLLEYRKTSYFFFFDKTSLMVIMFGIMFKFIMPHEAGSIFFTLFFSAYMLFFFTMQGKWPMELEKQYIFLVPESNSSKLLYCTLTENIKNLIDGILLFAISYFIYDASIIVAFLCVVSYTFYGAIYIYIDVLSRRLFGKVHSKPMLIFAKLFVSLFVIMPGIVLMAILYYGLKDEILAALAVAVWNFMATAILFMFSKSVLNNIEVTQ